MGSFSDYAEKKVLEHIVGRATFSAPTAYIALFTVTPSDSGGGTECPGANYARVTTDLNDWEDGHATAGTIQNALAITFPTANAGDWGTQVAFTAFDNSSGGNMLFWGALSVFKTVGNGDIVEFAAGDIDITLD